jgi:hypothetical protein
LELDFEEIKGMHAKYCHNACPETCCCMVLIMYEDEVMRRELELTNAWVGKKLGPCWDMSEPEAAPTIYGVACGD